MLENSTVSPQAENPRSIQDIEKAVRERWFYFFEWLTLNDLHTAFEREYLHSIQSVSYPIVVVILVVGTVAWTIWTPEWYLHHLLLVLWGAYSLMMITLFGFMMHRAWLFINSSNIVVTNAYYIWKNAILEKNNRESVNSFFTPYEEIFRRRFPWNLQPQVKEEWNIIYLIISKFKRIIKPESIDDFSPNWLQKKEVRTWKNPLIFIDYIGSILYSIVAGMLFIAWILIVIVMERILIHWIRLYLKATEWQNRNIHTYFEEITITSSIMKSEQERISQYFASAKNSEWKEDLLAKISESTLKVNQAVLVSYKWVTELQIMLESTQFYDMFDLWRFRVWKKENIENPIASLVILMRDGKTTFEDIIYKIDKDKKNHIWNSSAMLLFQEKRLRLTLQNIEETLHFAERYNQNI